MHESIKETILNYETHAFQKAIFKSLITRGNDSDEAAALFSRNKMLKWSLIAFPRKISSVQQSKPTRH